MITYGMSKSDVESAGKAGANNENRAKILDDFYLYTNKEEQSLGQWLSSQGYWESWITSWMTKNIMPGSICIDIGANYGYYTLLMQKLAGPTGGVYSFEANPELCELLSRSIAEAPDGYSPAALYSVAISDKKGTVSLDIVPDYVGGSTIVFDDNPPDIYEKRIIVPTDTLDNIIEPQKIDIIKMDIEGAEPLAWMGMQNTLENTELLIIEIRSYTPQWFLDDIYSKWNVYVVSSMSGEEVPLNKDVIPFLTDFVMAVLRKKNV